MKYIKFHSYLKNKKITLGKALLVAGVLTCMLGSSVSPALAKNTPEIKSVFQSMYDQGKVKLNYSKYSNEINQTVLDKGIEVKLDRVALDCNTLYTSFIVKSDKELTNIYDYWDYECTVDGKKVEPHSVKNYLISQESSKFIYTCMYETKFSNETISENPKIDMSIKKIADTTGKWDFKFEAGKENIAKYSKVYKPNCEAVFLGEKDLIDKITFSPVSVKINCTVKEKGKFSHPLASYVIVDDKGNELNDIFSSSNLGTGKIMYEFLPLQSKELPKSLTFIEPKDKGRLDKAAIVKTLSIDPKNIKVPATFVVETGGDKVTFKSVIYNNDTLTIDYHIDGINTLLCQCAIELFDENNQYQKNTNDDYTKGYSGTRDFSNIYKVDKDKKYILKIKDLNDIEELDLKNKFTIKLDK